MNHQWSQNTDNNLNEPSPHRAENVELNQYLDFYLHILNKKENKKILIIENDLFSFHDLKHTLQDFDPQLTCMYARTPEQAIQIIDATQCDLIVSESNLDTKGEGLQVCKTVKNACPDTQIAMITPTEPNQLHNIIKKNSHVAKFFHKPAYPKKLWKFIQKHFQNMSRYKETEKCPKASQV